MKKNKFKNIKYLLLFNMFLFVSDNYADNFQNVNTVFNNTRNIEKYITPNIYQKKYTHKYENFCIKNKKNQLIQQDHILSKYPLLSNLIINNHSIHLINSYLIKENQTIFNELELKHFKDKNIFNFGIGHRYFHNYWLLGYNIFYNTALSNLQQKTLSIGGEYWMNYIQISINSYFNTHHHLINNCFNNTKYVPYTFDIHIKNFIPYSNKINTYVNIEYFLYNKNTTFFLDKQTQKYKINTQKPLQLILGVNYTPIPIINFNFEKIISNPMKLYATQFNINFIYKLNTPYEQTNNTKNNINMFIHNIPNIITTNNNCKLFPYCNKNFFNIKNAQSNTKLNTYTNISSKYIRNNSQIIPNKKKHKIQNNKKNQNQVSYIIKKCIPCSNKIYTNHPKKNIKTTKNTYNLNKIKLLNKNNLKNINNINFNYNIKHTNQKNIQTKQIMQKKQYKSYQLPQQNNINIIPPAPLLNTEFNTTNINNNNCNRNKSNKNSIINLPDNDHINTSLSDHLQTIHTHKEINFSNIGSEEHISKLNNIITSRKSRTNSTNSDNSEKNTTLFQMIERQSIRMRENTDSDENNTETLKTTYSNNSLNTFSDTE